MNNHTDTMTLARAYVKDFAHNSPLWPVAPTHADIDRVACWFNAEMQPYGVATRDGMNPYDYVGLCYTNSRRTFLILWPDRWDDMGATDRKTWQATLTACLLDFLDERHVLGSANVDSYKEHHSLFTVSRP